MNEVVLKIRKKGVLILPKALRKSAGIEEGEVIAEVRDGEIVIRPLKPKVVDIDRSIIERLLSEEKKLEEEKFESHLRGIRS
ncbi:MAG: AbrB/MazE/SpoVT family DNA-binding domain-containing protein [Candidatus Methanomethyliaceae archaeon]|nr:AbrB/MazE/SpoVT family DNA-binding domain-containing protein [Candidatus Methanomethyliaceae archaeon]MDW7971076.1 AbrB/MazE/SpoVT family DNA-binding domain-containing protein [Nitrososphaerota archaeon]